MGKVRQSILATLREKKIGGFEKKVVIFGKLINNFTGRTTTRKKQVVIIL